MIRLNPYIPRKDDLVMAQKDEAMLIRTSDGHIHLIDRHFKHAFDLEPPSYVCGLHMMTRWPRQRIGIIRNHIDEAVGFWLCGGPRYVAMLADDTIPMHELSPTTRIFATPSKLQFRREDDGTWIPWLWHIKPAST